MTTRRKRAERAGHAQEPANAAPGPTLPNAIAHRAYERFQERGRETGRDLDDWLRAEQELTPLRLQSQAE